MAQGYTKGIPISTDGTLSTNSDLIIASQKAVKTYVDANIGNTTNSITFTDSAFVDPPPATFNGSYPVTIGTATIGAQPLDNKLSSLTALSYVSASFVKMTGTNTFTLDTNTYLTTSSAATTYQPLDSDLTSWAGITRASGFDTFATTPSSANLASLVTDETGTGSLVLATSPALLGTPTAPTASAGTNTTQIATTAYVATAITNLTASDIPSGIDAIKIGAGTVSNTEFGYLDGVTSAIQTQLTNKKDTFTIRMQMAGQSPADATTYYVGEINVSLNTTATLYRTTMPYASKLIGAVISAVNISATATTEASTINFRLNNTTDTLLSNAVAFGNNLTVNLYPVTGLNVTVAANDVFNIKWTTPTWATNPTSATLLVTLYFERT
jgi:hypothetical protein